MLREGFCLKVPDPYGNKCVPSVCLGGGSFEAVFGKINSQIVTFCYYKCGDNCVGQ